MPTNPSDYRCSERELDCAIKVFTLFGREAMSPASMPDHIALLTRVRNDVRNYASMLEWAEASKAIRYEQAEQTGLRESLMLWFVCTTGALMSIGLVLLAAAAR